MTSVSIIIPVYKVEDFLKRCLDSLIAQTYTDWEAICVDDGSPDYCPRILDDYAQSDSRFKVLHLPNGGAANARNAALAHITGKYCLFVDSDDFLHPQLLEITVGLASKCNTDMVTYTYHHPYHTLEEIRHALHLPDTKRIRYKKYDISKLKYLVVDNIYDWATEYPHPKGPGRRWVTKHCQPWRCLLRSEIAASVRFSPGIMYEDVPWWGEILLNVRKACLLNLPLYYYYPNKTGYIHSSRQQFRIESLKKAITESEKIYSEKANEEQKQKWENNFLSYFKSKLAKKQDRPNRSSISRPQ